MGGVTKSLRSLRGWWEKSLSLRVGLKRKENGERDGTNFCEDYARLRLKEGRLGMPG
jgi:hypothetical protein